LLASSSFGKIISKQQEQEVQMGKNQFNPDDNRINTSSLTNRQHKDTPDHSIIGGRTKKKGKEVIMTFYFYMLLGLKIGRAPPRPGGISSCLFQHVTE
jgi:hypothetical protein